MLKFDPNDTIAAIATPIGEGGIGIVRISGKGAISIADKIFVTRDDRKVSDYEAYTTHYGHVVSRGNVNEGKRHNTIDEVLLTVMKAPKSYTREDVVEINCHGGIIPLKKILELVFSLGARPAQPGEFTRRAFLNGRIDLAQAEAVLDVIRSKTQKSLDISILQLEGSLSSSVAQLKDKLLNVKVQLESAVDFPEEGFTACSSGEMKSMLDSIKVNLDSYVRSFESGKIIKEGVTCVICGKPNVGKSSLMNELLREDRVIVSPAPGTTRDAICECVTIDGVAFNMVDTAGITQTSDIIEKEGVIRSRLWIDRADLIIFVMDAVSGISAEDKEIIEGVKGKEVICVINKVDANPGFAFKQDAQKLFDRPVRFTEISVLNKINMDALRSALTDTVWNGRVSVSDHKILTNARHKDSFLKASKFVSEAIASLDQGQTEEIVSLSINEAMAALGEITGEVVSQEVLDRIFEQFCVGK